GRRPAGPIELERGARPKARTGQREVGDRTRLTPPALLLLIEAEQEIQLSAAVADRPLDAAPGQDHHDAMLSPRGVEAGVVEVQPPVLDEAELACHDLAIDLEQARPERAALEEAAADGPEKGAARRGRKTVVVSPAHLRLRAAPVQIEEDVEDGVE